METLRNALAINGIDPGRLRLDFLSVDDGRKFAQLMNEFEGELGEIVHSSSDQAIRHYP